MKKFLLLSLVALTAVGASATKHFSRVSRQADEMKAVVMQKVVSDRSDVLRQAAQAKVVKSVVAKNGTKVLLMENNGVASKHLIGAADAKVAAKKPRVALKDAAEGASFYEDFEEYDGTSWAWLPEGWKRESKAGYEPGATKEETAGYNFSWAVSAGAFTAMPQGKYGARVQFAHPVNTTGDEEAEPNYGLDPQDEWLYTPVFTPGRQEKITAIVQYSPFWYRINNDILFESFEFVFDAENCNLEVLLSEDGGKTFETKVFDAIEYSKQNYTDEELAEALGEDIQAKVSIDATDYVGKEVVLAFHYYGYDGESAVVDVVKSAIPQPEAYYYNPTGTLYSGLDIDWYSLTDTWTVLPAYTDVTWLNASNDDSEEFLWSYVDPEGTPTEEGFLSDMIETDDVDLTAQYGFYDSLDQNPILAASAGDFGAEYQADYSPYIQFGGDFDLTDYTAARNFGLTNWRDIPDAKGNSIGNWGFGIGYDDTWNRIFGTETSEARMSAVAQYFPSAGHPILLKGAWALASWQSTSDFEVTANVIAVNPDGTLGETVASATTTVPAQAEFGAGTIEFKFETIDPITQLPVDGEITVDNGFLLVFDWDKEAVDAAGVEALTFLANSDPVADGDTYGYFFIESTDLETGEAKQSLYPTDALSISTGPCYLSLCVMIDGSYTALEPLFDESEAIIDADVAGETRVFPVVTSEDTESIFVQEDEEGTLPEWVSYTLEDVYGEETAGRRKAETYQYTAFTVTIDALPEGTDYRETELTLRVPGDKIDFIITQGEYTGVNVVRKDNGIKVSTVGDNFVITAPADVKYVRVFNGAGQLVKTAALNGTTNVNNADLANGIYILRFSNKAVVKAVK